MEKTYRMTYSKNSTDRGSVEQSTDYYPYGGLFGESTGDSGRGIARIDYDRQNNPVRIQFTNGSVTRYVYSAAGEKLRVIHQTAVPNVTVPVGASRELSPSEVLSSDSTDWLLGGSLTLRNGSTDKLQFDEGYCQASRLSGKAGNDRDTFTFYYFDRDHLGSVRQVIEAEGAGVGAVLQRLSYYPSGLQLCYGSGTDSDYQGLRYSGKELDKMHGLNTYDFGACQYDPVTMRWDRMDPLCEKYYNISPYAYCKNNPMRFVDPDGRKPGDFFNSMDAAAIDFGLFFNDNSIRDNQEYNSSIILIFNGKGEKGYTYTMPSKGTFEKSSPSEEWGFKHVAFVHAHAGYSESHNNNQFSGLYLKDKDGHPIRFYTKAERILSKSIDDIGLANRNQQVAYVSTPNGSLQKYESDTGKITVISNEMPSDKNDPDRLNSVGTEERQSSAFNYNTYIKTISRYRSNYWSNFINSMK